MRIKTIVDEDFVNYKKPSMFIGTYRCNWKCCNEQGLDHRICQNSELANLPVWTMSDDILTERYLSNPITSTIVFGGLEPLDQKDEVFEFIRNLRDDYHCSDTVVIYTGYKAEEIQDELKTLAGFGNVIVKVGRFVPNNEPHYDEVLGVKLVSDNQYAARAEDLII